MKPILIIKRAIQRAQGAGHSFKDLLIGDPHQVDRGDPDLSPGLVQRPRHDQLDGAGPGGEAPRARLDEVDTPDGELLGCDSIENVGLENCLDAYKGSLVKCNLCSCRARSI